MEQGVAVNLLRGIIESVREGDYSSAQFILKELRIAWSADQFWAGIHTNIEEAVEGRDRYLAMDICRWAIARMRPVNELRLAV